MLLKYLHRKCKVETNKGMKFCRNVENSVKLCKILSELTTRSLRLILLGIITIKGFCKNEYFPAAQRLSPVGFYLATSCVRNHPS